MSSGFINNIFFQKIFFKTTANNEKYMTGNILFYIIQNLVLNRTFLILKKLINQTEKGVVFLFCILREIYLKV